MTALVATDVTYTMKSRSITGNSNKDNLVQLTFGDGVKTYPAGGIPLTIGNLGLPTVCRGLSVVDCTNANLGYEFFFDVATNKLQILSSAGVAHSHPLTLKNAAVADGATTRVNAGTNLLGANTGSDLTVAGGGANGGVQNATPGNASLAEVTGVAIAAQSITVRAYGH